MLGLTPWLTAGPLRAHDRRAPRLVPELPINLGIDGALGTLDRSIGPISLRSVVMAGRARHAKEADLCLHGGCAPGPHRRPARWRSLGRPGPPRSAGRIRH